jgi:hypothetical protein
LEFLALAVLRARGLDLPCNNSTMRHDRGLVWFAWQIRAVWGSEFVDPIGLSEINAKVDLI